MPRLPSLLAGTAAIPLIYLIGDRTVGRRAAARRRGARRPQPVHDLLLGRGPRLPGDDLLRARLDAGAAARSLRDVRAAGGSSTRSRAAAAMYTHYTAAFWLLAASGWLLWARPDLRARCAARQHRRRGRSSLPGSPACSPTSTPRPPRSSARSSPSRSTSSSTALSALGDRLPLLGDRPRPLPGTLGLVLIGLALGSRRRSGSGCGSADERPRSIRRLVLVICLALAAPVGEALVSAVSTDLFGTRNLAVVLAGPCARCRRLGHLAARAGSGSRRPRCCSPPSRSPRSRCSGRDYRTPDFEAAAELIDAEAGPGDVVIDGSVFSPGPLAALDVQLNEAAPDPPRRRAPAGRLPVQRVRPDRAAATRSPSALRARRRAGGS